MLVRNNARTLGRCLDSLRPFVDQIVVVDTGSTDGSQDIATTFGAEVFELAWPDRFDVALNFGFERVQTAWTLRFDADEWLDDASGARLVHFAATAPNSMAYMRRRDLSPDGGFSESRLVRMWRTSPFARVYGVIHDRFKDGLALQLPGDGTLAETDLVIWHDGFAIGDPEEKLKRNLPMLHRQVMETPDSFYDLAELGRTLCALRDPEGARIMRMLAQRLLDAGDHDESPEHLGADVLCSVADQLEENEIYCALSHGVSNLLRGWYWGEPLPMLSLGQLEIRRGNLLAALEALYVCLDSLSDPRQEVGTSFRRTRVEIAATHNLLTLCLKLGRSEEARKLAIRLQSLDPSDELATAALAVSGAS